MLTFWIRAMASALPELERIRDMAFSRQRYLERQTSVNRGLLFYHFYSFESGDSCGCWIYRCRNFYKKQADMIDLLAGLVSFKFNLDRLLYFSRDFKPLRRLPLQHR